MKRESISSSSVLQNRSMMAIDPVRRWRRSADARRALSAERSLRIEGLSGAPAPSPSLSGTSFTFTDVPLAEGRNRLTLVAADTAGNEARYVCEVRVKSTAPTIEIVENGAPIPPNAIYNRAVTPVIRVSEPDATIAAPANGAVPARASRGMACSVRGSNSLALPVVSDTRHGRMMIAAA